MNKPPLTRISLSFLVFTALLLSSCGESGSGPGPQGGGFPSPEVVAYTVGSSEVVLNSELPGRTTAFRHAEVRPQVSGIIVERLFQEGQLVEVGQPLYQIDDRVFRAELDVRQAALASAESALELAELRYGRFAKRE